MEKRRYTQKTKSPHVPRQRVRPERTLPKVQWGELQESTQQRLAKPKKRYKLKIFTQEHRAFIESLADKAVHVDDLLKFNRRETNDSKKGWILTASQMTKNHEEECKNIVTLEDLNRDYLEQMKLFVAAGIVVSPEVLKEIQSQTSDKETQSVKTEDTSQSDTTPEKSIKSEPSTSPETEASTSSSSLPSTSAASPLRPSMTPSPPPVPSTSKAPSQSTLTQQPANASPTTGVSDESGNKSVRFAEDCEVIELDYDNDYFFSQPSQRRPSPTFDDQESNDQPICASGQDEEDEFDDSEPDETWLKLVRGTQMPNRTFHQERTQRTSIFSIRSPVNDETTEDSIIELPRVFTQAPATNSNNEPSVIEMPTILTQMPQTVENGEDEFYSDDLDDFCVIVGRANLASQRTTSVSIITDDSNEARMAVINENEDEDQFDPSDDEEDHSKKLIDSERLNADEARMVVVNENEDEDKFDPSDDEAQPDRSEQLNETDIINLWNAPSSPSREIYTQPFPDNVQDDNAEVSGVDKFNDAFNASLFDEDDFEDIISQVKYAKTSQH